MVPAALPALPALPTPLPLAAFLVDAEALAGRAALAGVVIWRLARVAPFWLFALRFGLCDPIRRSAFL